MDWFGLWLKISSFLLLVWCTLIVAYTVEDVLHNYDIFEKSNEYKMELLEKRSRVK